MMSDTSGHHEQRSLSDFSWAKAAVLIALGIGSIFVDAYLSLDLKEFVFPFVLLLVAVSNVVAQYRLRSIMEERASQGFAVSSRVATFTWGNAILIVALGVGFVPLVVRHISHLPYAYVAFLGGFIVIGVVATLVYQWHLRRIDAEFAAWQAARAPKTTPVA